MCVRTSGILLTNKFSVPPNQPKQLHLVGYFICQSQKYCTRMLRKACVIVCLAVGLFFLRKHMNGCEYNSGVRLDGKVVIVTGANTGIGKETALDMAQRGAKVYLACRSLDKAQQALDDIQKESGAADNQLMVLQLDLSSFKSVRKFAAEFKSRETKLDLLINNAGVWPPANRVLVNTFEIAFVTNHLGPFLLTHLLLDQLVAAAPSRIINVSTKLYKNAPLNFDDLMLTKNYNDEYAYSQSKTANNLFTVELANRLKGSGVVAYALHPGLIHTDLMRHNAVMSHPLVNPFFSIIVWPFLKDRKHGIQTTLFCALDSNIDDLSGKYFSDCAEEDLMPHASDPAIAKRLWDVSVDMVRLQPGETHSLLKS